MSYASQIYNAYIIGQRTSKQNQGLITIHPIEYQNIIIYGIQQKSN